MSQGNLALFEADPASDQTTIHAVESPLSPPPPPFKERPMCGDIGMESDGFRLRFRVLGCTGQLGLRTERRNYQ